MHTCTVSTREVQFPANPSPTPSSAISRQEARWLASLQFWAAALLRKLRIPEPDITEAVLEAFRRVKLQWADFEPPVDLPPRTARRRWIASLLFHFAAEHRRESRRAQHATGGPTAPSKEETSAGPREPMLTFESLFRRFHRGAAAERWRVWMAREVDGVTLAEIAWQEGCTRARAHRLLELAWRDLISNLTQGDTALAASRSGA